jgi:hypothetical protein
MTFSPAARRRTVTSAPSSSFATVASWSGAATSSSAVVVGTQSASEAPSPATGVARTRNSTSIVPSGLRKSPNMSSIALQSVAPGGRQFGSSMSETRNIVPPNSGSSIASACLRARGMGVMPEGLDPSASAMMRRAAEGDSVSNPVLASTSWQRGPSAG